MQRAQKFQVTLHSRNSFTLAIVRNQTVKKALCFIYFMIGCNCYSLVYTVLVYAFYTNDCVPQSISI